MSTEITIFSANATAPYVSLDLSTETNRKLAFNASGNPNHKLKEFINKPIKLKDFIYEPVTLVDENTGEVQENVPRFVLIDDKGVSYSATSSGVFTAMRRLITMYGDPSTWEKPIAIIPCIIDKGANRQITSFELA